MKFNGIDLRDVHPLVSLDHCGVSGWRRDLRRIEAAKSDLIVGARDVAGEFFALVNISGRTPEAGEEALAAVRAWAFADGKMHEIDDEKSPGRVLDGMLQEIDQPEMVHGFGTVRIVWTLEDVHKRSTAESRAEASGATSLQIVYTGTAEAYPMFEVAPTAAADEIVLTLDGKPLLRLTERMVTGQQLIMDTRHQLLTLDGRDVRSQTDWTQTDYDMPLTTGTHELVSNVPGILKARWNDRWA